jgi:hypothetical protein
MVPKTLAKFTTGHIKADKQTNKIQVEVHSNLASGIIYNVNCHYSTSQYLYIYDTCPRNLYGPRT